VTRAPRESARGRIRALGARSVRAALAVALGAAAALLVSCSGSGAGLIPAGNAGPLRGDFEAVAHAAETGNGKCSETEAALSKTELDFAALPASVNGELRGALRTGIANLKVRALALCALPIAQPTNTTPATTQTTTTTKAPTTTSTPSTQTTTNKAPPTTPTTNPEGGTPPEESKGGGAEQGGEEPLPKESGGQEAGK
jgi:hypothetical protein